MKTVLPFFFCGIPRNLRTKKIISHTDSDWQLWREYYHFFCGIPPEFADKKKISHRLRLTTLTCLSEQKKTHKKSPCGLKKDGPGKSKKTKLESASTAVKLTAESLVFDENRPLCQGLRCRKFTNKSQQVLRCYDRNSVLLSHPGLHGNPSTILIQLQMIDDIENMYILIWYIIAQQM